MEWVIVQGLASLRLQSSGQGARHRSRSGLRAQQGSSTTNLDEPVVVAKRELPASKEHFVNEVGEVQDHGQRMYCKWRSPWALLDVKVETSLCGLPV